MIVCKAGSNVKLRHEGACTGKITSSVKFGCLNTIKQYNDDVVYVIVSFYTKQVRLKTRKTKTKFPKVQHQLVPSQQNPAMSARSAPST